MIGSSENRSVPFDQNEAMQVPRSKSVEQLLEQFHADFDPVYNMLMDYQCSAMEVETKFNILNNRLRYKKNLGPQLAQELADDLQECAEESARLDKKMTQIRDRIQGAV